MEKAVIVSAVRSPIGRAGKGSLREVRPDDLVASMIREALGRVPELDPHEVEDVIVGCGGPAGQQGYNIGRIAALLVGLEDVPGTTVNRYCGSSVQSTRMAMHAIAAGEGHAFVAAGVESVSSRVHGTADGMPESRNPRFDRAMERTARQVTSEETGWTDPATLGGLGDPYIAMGQTAENVARLRGISREDQDAFALRSQQRAVSGIDNGFWAREITPVTLADGTVVDTDDGPRRGTTLEGLANLKPVFREDGTVTAGNACPLNDGAAALVVMSESRARELGIAPLARIVASAAGALSPEIMGLGPVPATRKALALAGMSVADLDLVEINEAFAAQVIPSAEDLGVDLDKLNVNGGAIAVGHPFGMTGARMITTLLNGLSWHDKSTGLVTMCTAGGQGMAVIVERLA